MRQRGLEDDGPSTIPWLPILKCRTMCAMNVPLVWPRISDKTSARRAVKAGVWMCGLLALLDGGIGAYLLITRHSFRDYNPSVAWVGIEFGVMFGIVALGVWRNSRIAAVIGLLLIVWAYRDKFQSLPSAVIPVLFLLVLLGAARGTFAIRKFSEVGPKN
jgi:hypothetical protein